MIKILELEFDSKIYFELKINGSLHNENLYREQENFMKSQKEYRDIRIIPVFSQYFKSYYNVLYLEEQLNVIKNLVNIKKNLM